ncbi:MAG: hypothetical protein HDQ91_00995 [Desulfovibrio sp.]|nr:hypothetical protein [Desulfovibrio sp.]
MKRIAAAFICILALAACARQPSGTADVPRLLPQSYRIAVAPFTQPLNPGQLITGQIPENQGLIPQDGLLALDLDLRQTLLSGTRRQYDFIPPQNLAKELDHSRSTGQAGALPRWLEYGKAHNAQLLLVPMILNWHEREGSQAGVTSSAHARVEFFLLSIPDKGVMNRSIYEEKQVGLVDNLLTVGDFVKRKGQWVSARDLAVEAMTQAVRDLGL